MLLLGLTLMTGLLYVLAGLGRLGIMANFLSQPILTAKSFARRNGYSIDANQELVAFGACNLASGLAQGFPVTGADSRTAVNNAMGGKTQLVGVVAGGAMLLVVIFMTAPLAFVPTTAGVLLLGVLPGVLLAVALSLIWLLSVGSRPNDAVLGRVAGRKGFHSTSDYPEAKTLRGLLLYRFESNIVFYNADYFKSRVLAVVAAQEPPVRWVVIDASPINPVDVTGLRKVDELREELARAGATLAVVRMKRYLERFFEPGFVEARRAASEVQHFDSVKLAINAFIADQKAHGVDLGGTFSEDQATLSTEWNNAIEPPADDEPSPVPASPASGG